MNLASLDYKEFIERDILNSKHLFTSFVCLNSNTFS